MLFPLPNTSCTKIFPASSKIANAAIQYPVYQPINTVEAQQVPTPPLPNPVQQQPVNPPPSVIDNVKPEQPQNTPVQQPVQPPVNQAQQTQQTQQTQQQDQEAVKPLIDALNIISPKQGAAPVTEEQKEQAPQPEAQQQPQPKA